MKRIYTLIPALALMGFVLMGCDDPKGAKRALENQGYTDISLSGWSLWGCGKDDSFTTEFTAKSATGQTVDGVVCSGWFKGATIRTY